MLSSFCRCMGCFVLHAFRHANCGSDAGCNRNCRHLRSWVRHSFCFSYFTGLDTAFNAAFCSGARLWRAQGSRCRESLCNEYPILNKRYALVSLALKACKKLTLFFGYTISTLNVFIKMWCSKANALCSRFTIYDNTMFPLQIANSTLRGRCSSFNVSAN